MNLFVLRHAEAEDKGPWIGRDHERPLTSIGLKKFQLCAKGMKQMGLEFDAIISSPLIRARQTAEIAAKVFRAEKRLLLSKHLEPEGSPGKIVEEIRQAHMDRLNVALVGHEPYLSRLISHLTTGGPNLSLEFKKGSLCKLAIIERLIFGRCAALKWLLTPRQLMSLSQPGEAA